MISQTPRNASPFTLRPNRLVWSSETSNCVILWADRSQSLRHLSLPLLCIPPPPHRLFHLPLSRLLPFHVTWFSKKSFAATTYLSQTAGNAFGSLPRKCFPPRARALRLPPRRPINAQYLTPECVSHRPSHRFPTPVVYLGLLGFVILR